MAVDAVYQTDIETYINSLPITDDEKEILLSGTTDGETLDAAILADPAFLAYWQATYVTLMMHIDPITSQAGLAEIGSGDISGLYDYLQANASTDASSAVQEYVLEHAGLLGLDASTDGDSGTDPQAILDAINAYDESTSGTYNYTNDEAYAMVDDLNLDNADQLNYAISASDWATNILMICQDQLLNFQAQFSTIADAMSSGEISAEIAQAEFGQVTASMQFWTGIQQNTMSQTNNILEMFSQLMKSDSESKQQLTSNIKSTAA